MMVVVLVAVGRKLATVAAAASAIVATRTLNPSAESASPSPPPGERGKRRGSLCRHCRVACWMGRRYVAQQLLKLRESATQSEPCDSK